MAANGISRLVVGDGSDPIANKAARQVAKLDLAQTKRQTIDTNGYRQWNIYDRRYLSNAYGIPDNEQIWGLRTRPWVGSTEDTHDGWILATGDWDDSGIWLDNEEWNDGV